MDRYVTLERSVRGTSRPPCSPPLTRSRRDIIWQKADVNQQLGEQPGLAISRLTPLLEKHPDKTFIGRIERGFDFLGYHFGQEGLSVAKTTIENFVEPAIRLYEQEPGKACASARLGSYVRRWVGWTTAGVAVACIPAPIGAAAG
jgi:hypothetical protein